MNNKSQIIKLKQLIENILTPLIDRDYVLLDIPDYENIGDHLILAGELEFLKHLSYKMTYVSNLNDNDFSKIGNDSIILLQGGGNFGDIWRRHQDFRSEVIRRFPNNRIIVFPQSIHYDDNSLLKLDAELYSKHKDLTICARDNESFLLLKNNFSNNILLLPDMAFCLSFDSEIKSKESALDNVLILKRRDKEIDSTTDSKIEEILSIHKNDNVDIVDWPTYDPTTMLAIERKRYHKEISNKLKYRVLLNQPLFNEQIKSYINRKVEARCCIGRKYTTEEYIKMGVDFIMPYDVIYTTRLHVLILSVLLGKKVYVLDNYYGKNMRFYHTWLKDFNNIELIDC